MAIITDRAATGSGTAAVTGAAGGHPTHFVSPFRFQFVQQPGGGAAVRAAANVQGSPQDIKDRMRSVCLWPQGSRIDDPSYGNPLDPFDSEPLDLQPLINAVEGSVGVRVSATEDVQALLAGLNPGRTTVTVTAQAPTTEQTPTPTTTTYTETTTGDAGGSPS